MPSCLTPRRSRTSAAAAAAFPQTPETPRIRCRTPGKVANVREKAASFVVLLPSPSASGRRRDLKSSGKIVGSPGEISAEESVKFKTPTKRTKISHQSVAEAVCTDLIAKENVYIDPEISPVERVYRTARAYLHPSHKADSLIGRERELGLLKDFFTDRLTNTRSGSLYACGPPGGGKTVAVDLALASVADTLVDRPRVARVNCVGLDNAEDVFRRALEAIADSPSTVLPMDVRSLWLDTGNARLAFERLTSGVRRRVMTVWVLDEIDQLLTARNGAAVLEDIFMLPQVQDSRLIIVGIANATDLTDKALGRVHQLQCQPSVITFEPYSVENLVQILRQRLGQACKASAIESVSCKPLVAPSALELLARKSSARAPDLRRSLGLLSRAISLAQREWLQRESGVEGSMVQVGIMHVLTAVKETDGADGKSIKNRIAALSMQQKLVMVAILHVLATGQRLAAEASSLIASDRANCPDLLGSPPATPTRRKSTNGAPTLELTVGMVQDTCTRLVNKYGLCAGLSSSEVADLLRNLSGIGGLIELDESLTKGIKGVKRRWDGSTCGGSVFGERARGLQLIVASEEVVLAVQASVADGAGGAALRSMLVELE